MEFEFLNYEKRDRIAYITITRPERLNALHPPASLEMRNAMLDFCEDPELWVAVLSGSGERAFCAGNDLKYHAEHGAKGEAYPGAEKVPFGGITDDFECWKPIIAAVNGYAMGGGLEIALACDLIVADTAAQFGAPEVNVGLVAAAGGVHRIPRQLPIKVGMKMLLTGKPINSEEAFQWGLINEIAPKGRALEAATRLAEEIVDGAPLSVRASKQMAMLGLGMSLEEAMKANYSQYEQAIGSEDFIEGPKAFTEKRRPNWKGH